MARWHARPPSRARFVLSAVTLTVLLLSLLSCGGPPRRSFVLATTTSVDNSGLLRHLAAAFEKESGIEIHPIVVGSGKALQLATRGEAEATLTHDPIAEARFVKDGHTRFYRQFMRNDFVLVGPPADPAGVRGSKSAIVAMQRIAAKRATFCSRSDWSGTHTRELELWREAKVDPASNPNYTRLGQSMANLLRSAGDLDGYALTDRATFQQLSARIGLEILFEGDPRFVNLYAVSLIRRSPLREEDRSAEVFVRWLLSPRGRRAIEGYKIAGRQQFFPL